MGKREVTLSLYWSQASDQFYIVEYVPKKGVYQEVKRNFAAGHIGMTRFLQANYSNSIIHIIGHSLVAPQIADLEEKMKEIGSEIHFPKPTTEEAKEDVMSLVQRELQDLALRIEKEYGVTLKIRYEVIKKV